MFVCVSLVLVVFTYGGLFRMFYQQDEWRALGLFLADGITGSFKGTSVLQLAIGSGRPLSVPFLYIFLHNFSMQIWPFALFSITMHTANGILVYVIASLLTGNIIAGWVAGSFFLLSYNGSQAVTWFATNISALSSVFFGLLSIVLVLLYARRKKILFIIWAQLCVIFSYLFKEFSIILIVILPAVLVLFQQTKTRLMGIIKLFLPLTLYFVFAFILTIIRLLTPLKPYGAFVGQSSGGMLTIFQNALYYPLLSFSQTFLPYPIIIKLYPSLKLVSLSNDLLFIFLSILLLTGIYATIVRYKKQRNMAIFATIFILVSFTPYAVLRRGASYLDSRYFYFAMTGGALIFGMYVNIVMDKLRSTAPRVRNSIFCILLILYAGYAYKNVQLVLRDIGSQIVLSRERLSVISQIKNVIPLPPDNPIFYISGDVENFYLIPDQHMPFQQGIGYTLMCIYYKTGKVPLRLLSQEDAFLWGFEQGYREIDGKGFGYYWDKQLLRDTLKQHPEMKPEQIVGLYYFGKTHQITDISSEIRSYIREQ
jgi:hypothetical protein